MRQYRFICDGCEDSATRDDATRPDHWADVVINVVGFTNWRSGGKAKIEETFLLCSSCQIYLQEGIVPRNWARVKAGGTEILP